MSVAAPHPSCSVCGFTWNLVGPDLVEERVTRAVAGMSRALVDAGDRVTERPEPTRWSSLEYAGHVRDVLWSLRERTILACVEDHPRSTPIHRDERVDLGFYRGDTVAVLVTELDVAAGLFVRTFAAVRPEWLARTIDYSPLFDFEVNVRWLGAQAVHESEHHLTDVRENLARLAAS